MNNVQCKCNKSNILYKFAFKTVETVYTKDADTSYPPAGVLSSIKNI